MSEAHVWLRPTHGVDSKGERPALGGDWRFVVGGVSRLLPALSDGHSQAFLSAVPPPPNSFFDGIEKDAHQSRDSAGKIFIAESQFVEMRS